MKFFFAALSFVMLLTLSACPSGGDDTQASSSATPTPTLTDTPQLQLSETLTANKKKLTQLPLNQQTLVLNGKKTKFKQIDDLLLLSPTQSDGVQHYYFQGSQLFLYEEVSLNGQTGFIFWDEQNKFKGQIFDVNGRKVKQLKTKTNMVLSEAKALLKAFKAPQLSSYKGLVTQEDNYLRFHPCQAEDSFLLESEALLPRLQALDLLEGEPAYLEFKGDFKERKYQAKKIVTTTPWNPQDGCFSLANQALGSHPDWTLHILKGKQVFFKALEGEFPAVEHFAYSEPKQEGNDRVYQLQLLRGPKSQMSVRFTKAECSHGGKVYPFQVRMKYYDIHYSGCGE